MRISYPGVRGSGFHWQEGKCRAKHLHWESSLLYVFSPGPVLTHCGLGWVDLGTLGSKPTPLSAAYPEFRCWDSKAPCSAPAVELGGLPFSLTTSCAAVMRLHAPKVQDCFFSQGRDLSKGQLCLLPLCPP